MSFDCTKRTLATATLANLDSVQAIETEGQPALVGTNQFREGVRAFEER